MQDQVHGPVKVKELLNAKICWIPNELRKASVFGCEVSR